MNKYVLALDQGTTSSRAIVFDRRGQIVAMSQQEFPQILPRPGVVEHDPEAIWKSQLDVARQALTRGGLTAAEIATIGVTNQRETTILWERDSGRPVHNALVWQSRVSSPICERLRQEGHDADFRQTTGLLIDPYFSATKIVYLFEQIPSPPSACRTRRDSIRYGRQLLDLAINPGAAPRDRRQQCEPHIDDEFANPGLGRPLARDIGNPSSDVAGDCRIQRCLG